MISPAGKGKASPARGSTHPRQLSSSQPRMNLLCVEKPYWVKSQHLSSFYLDQSHIAYWISLWLAVNLKSPSAFSQVSNLLTAKTRCLWYLIFCIKEIKRPSIQYHYVYLGTTHSLTTPLSMEFLWKWVAKLWIYFEKWVPNKHFIWEAPYLS